MIIKRLKRQLDTFIYLYAGESRMEDSRQCRSRKRQLHTAFTPGRVSLLAALRTAWRGGNLILLSMRLRPFEFCPTDLNRHRFSMS